MSFQAFWELYKDDMSQRLRKNTVRTKDYIIELKIIPYFWEKQMVMREIAGQIQSGDFSLSKESYQELKDDYLSLVVTVVDIVDGASYLLGKETPSDRRNWKAELELE